jgi:Uma2 family endonuclease
VLSPDAAVVRLERWQELTSEQRRGFPLVSPSDEGPRGSEALRRKLAGYIANRAQLGWLLFPEQRAAHHGPPWVITGSDGGPMHCL